MKTNRDYFSYSQFALWESSRKAFYKRYGLGEYPPATKYQRFGSEVMKALEYDDFSKIPEAANIPKLHHIEAELRAPLSVGKLHVNLLGIIDTATHNFTRIVDYKTGKNPWTQADVDSSEQLLFYAVLVYMNYGIIPQCSIIHLETRDSESGGVELTGKITEFVRKPIQQKQIAAFAKRIQKAIVEIEEYEYSHAEIADGLSEEFARLTSEKKRIDARLDALKSEIMTIIISNKTTYAESADGVFTVAKRSRWNYSDDLKKKEGELKAAKKDEESSGVATKSETSYLLYKPKNY